MTRISYQSERYQLHCGKRGHVLCASASNFYAAIQPPSQEIKAMADILEAVCLSVASCSDQNRLPVHRCSLVTIFGMTRNGFM